MGAEVPTVLNYQGTLTDNIGDPVTGAQEITFSLYSVPVAGIPFWSNTETVTLDLTGHFSVTIGDSSPVDRVAYEQNFNGETFIGIQVGTNPELMPRQKFTSVAYSVKAGNGIPTGGIIMWSGAIVDIPSGWALCDGNNGTPDLEDRFVLGTGNRFAPGDTGGEEQHILTEAEMPSHHHSVDPPSTSTSATGNHRHSIPANDFTTDGSDRNGQVSGGRDRDANIAPNSNYAGEHAHYVNIPQFNSGSIGSGQPHNNLPPYYVLAFIMKL